MNRFDKRLKNLLVKNAIVSLDEADQLLNDSSDGAAPLAERVVEQALVSEEQLIGMIATEMKLPPIDLDRIVPDSWALETMSRDSATSYGVLPIARVGNVLTLATANPFDLLRLDDLALLTGCTLRPVVASARQIDAAVQSAYSMSKEQMEHLFDGVDDVSFAVEDVQVEEDDSAVEDETGESPVVKLVNLVIFQAIREGVSDIHIEPSETKTRVRYRKDGMLYETISSPRRMHNSITSRIKIMAGLDIAEKFKPQDGKFRLKVEGRKIDFRVSVMPVLHGEKVVLRILDASNLALSLEDLGFEPRALDSIRESLAAPYGLILVTGPTGSGKSTTLYSSLKEMVSVKDNTVTVEDPVEYQLDGIYQVNVNVKRGLTFASALRSILRQDPDVIMVGEIRDRETVDIAVRAALTGHLVLSTLHTNDAPSAITRMIDMGVDPFLVAASTLLVSAQRLCRRLCPDCRERIDLPEQELLHAGFPSEQIAAASLYRAVGCNRCVDGYRGRFALLETLPMTERVRRLVTESGSVQQIKAAGMAEGMVTLRQAGIQNVLKGHTSLEEVLSVTVRDSLPGESDPTSH